MTTLQEAKLPDRTRHLTLVETPADEARNEDQAADREFDRFARVAVPMPGGGLRDPGECSAELARQIRVGGVSGEDWDSFIDDVGRLGRRRD